MTSKLRKRKKIFRHRLFTLSIKLQISKCHVVVVQERQGNVLKSMLHVQSCFCLIKTIVFLPYTWLLLKLPNYAKTSFLSHKIHSTKYLHLPLSPRNNDCFRRAQHRDMDWKFKWYIKTPRSVGLFFFMSCLTFMLSLYSIFNVLRNSCKRIGFVSRML